MALKLVFDTKAEWEAYDDLALLALKNHHSDDNCDGCTPSESLLSCKEWCLETTSWSSEYQRLTDSKWICEPCEHMNNESYTSEEDAESWYPAHGEI